MSASLVGSEMCIRDRYSATLVGFELCSPQLPLPQGAQASGSGSGAWPGVPVSYTHLTLPTICSV
eukprot:13231393-Alexandrium_andersonii.AAC.1